MRIVLTAFMFLIAVSGVASQPRGEAEVDRAVGAFLAQKPSLTLIDGQMETVLNRGGDSAAVAVTKAVAGREMTTVDVERALLIIREAFAAPKIIENSGDREPRTTLFVLRHLDSLSLPQEIKARIAETREYVEKAARSVPNNGPK